MAQQIASGFSGTDEMRSNPFGALQQATIMIEFVSAGDLDIKATPDGGTTVLGDAETFSSDTWDVLSPAPAELILDARNGAEVNVWLEKGQYVEAR
jgi:hypothetical protein